VPDPRASAMRHVPDQCRLLFGPHHPSPLKRGARAFCLARDCLVVVTSWSAGRIQWPRCRALDGTGGGSDLLVDEALACAVRQESAAAVMHWWGVGSKAVWRWRKALGVGRTDSPGMRRLIQAAAEATAGSTRKARRCWVCRSSSRPPRQDRANPRPGITTSTDVRTVRNCPASLRKSP
jgi:hypothetical protein